MWKMFRKPLSQLRELSEDYDSYIAHIQQSSSLNDAEAKLHVLRNECNDLIARIDNDKTKLAEMDSRITDKRLIYEEKKAEFTAISEEMNQRVKEIRQNSLATRINSEILRLEKELKKPLNSNAETQEFQESLEKYMENQQKLLTLKKYSTLIPSSQF
eukprot:MONOS_8585.1-p1 / transcript=MONOS_8585.1 / gene=MONOS_8585 / organism=Monocercomonoides_exilis_PA203 / gene_product=unspecified product / transcript_product=unspecified product / location=Mono_scaffold00327:22291-22882(+) / protein_length=158 / sequence_SO=supercontig / SO=protein_coding / is_pseudo=false